MIGGFCLLSIIILLSLIQNVRCESLATPFDGPNDDRFGDGDKFGILTGDSEVTIERFDIHMSNITETVQVWIRDGDFPDHANTGTLTKVLEEVVTGQGQGIPTPLSPFDPPIVIPANSILGVYSLVDNYQGNDMYHSTGLLGEEQVFISDDFISITEGISQWTPHNSFQWPTRWNGIVYYSTPQSPSSSPSISALPSVVPSFVPSSQPSTEPTVMQSSNPSDTPSLQPSEEPTSMPSLIPTSAESQAPSNEPSSLPTQSPSISAEPSSQPSSRPSISGRPSQLPSTTSQPSALPSQNPSGINPTSTPTLLPSQAPTKSQQPSSIPTQQPSKSAIPSSQPSDNPTSTVEPSLTPTGKSSSVPSSIPTIESSNVPSSGSQAPSGQSTSIPSESVSVEHSDQPSPTTEKTIEPSVLPLSKSSRLAIGVLHLPSLVKTRLPLSCYSPMLTTLFNPHNKQKLQTQAPRRLNDQHQFSLY